MLFLYASSKKSTIFSSLPSRSLGARPTSLLSLSITESGTSTVGTITTGITSSPFCVQPNDNAIPSTAELCSNNASLASSSPTLDLSSAFSESRLAFSSIICFSFAFSASTSANLSNFSLSSGISSFSFISSAISVKSLAFNSLNESVDCMFDDNFLYEME
ncbi:hypothetical protein RirG_206290 [Rhizophagus irregularis DAOM 197198w]|uniref:Uncharacterized protein n=1 Tax=Rhizophagus irregularis (strain DAOM 197198w) TaxID=1432141 RepID=A0A015JR59_RHIIW|nr:hypothetical protein RirG_206290 [Rhizophagus irregularis DAOM 197198w]